MSLGVGVVSWGLAHRFARKDGGAVFGRRALMFWYFGLIEFLQLAQYMVADQCDSRLNQALTYAAYLHVAFQPWVVNNYFWGGFKRTRGDLVNFILRLSLVGGVMMMMRLPGMPLGLLGDYAHNAIPDLPPSSMHGQGCHYLEANCGPKLCSVTGQAWGHISWSVPLLPSTYFVPGASMHAILFFLPTLIAGTWPARALMLAALAMGPLTSMAFSAAGPATYHLEWPTIWCFFAAIQSMVALTTEALFPDAFSAPAKPATAATSDKLSPAFSLTADGTVSVIAAAAKGKEA